jgi:hypothetical protein
VSLEVECAGEPIKGLKCIEFGVADGPAPADTGANSIALDDQSTTFETR